MSYTPTAGSISLFKNHKKEKPSQPDYRGDGADLNGTPIWASAWLKEGKKGKYLSISLQSKEASQHDPAGSAASPVKDDDEVGF